MASLITVGTLKDGKVKVEATCPNGHSVKAPPSALGKRVKCPKCACVFRLQASSPSAEEIAASVLTQPDPEHPSVKHDAENPLAAFAKSPPASTTSGEDPVWDEPDLPEAYGDAQFSSPVVNSAAYAPKIRPPEPEETTETQRPTYLRLGIFALSVGGLVAAGALGFVWWSDQSARQPIANLSDDDPSPPGEQALANSHREPASNLPHNARGAGGPANGSRTGNRNNNSASDETQPKFQLSDTPSATDESGLASRVQRSKTKVLFGFDRDRRAVFSSYLQAHGYGKGKAGVTILKVLGRLNGVAKVLGLEPDEYNYVDLPPDSFADFRRAFELGEVFSIDDFRPNLPDELTMIEEDYLAGRLEGLDLENAFLICLAYWVEES